MAAKIRLSSRLLTDVFWDILFLTDEEREPEKRALFQRLNALEDLRSAADYNTGSVALSVAWSLYNVVRYFKPARIIEVGTFIGKSTIAMAAAMDDQKAPGEIFTCDMSNALTLPWDGRSRIHQFQKTSSTDMLKRLEGSFDLVFLDGRLQAQDMPLVDALVTPETIFVLDDFEGIEKGVVNLDALLRREKLKSHFVIYPPTRAWLLARGYTSHSLTAVLLPTSAFQFTRQG